MPSTILFINFIYLLILIAAFHKNLSEFFFGVKLFLPWSISESFHRTASPDSNFKDFIFSLIFIDVFKKLKNFQTNFKDFSEFFFEIQ